MNKLISIFSSLALVFSSVFVFSVVPAYATTPTWNLNAPRAISFVCSGTSYDHTLNTVSENSTTGDFTGTGFYNPDPVNYPWNITGNVSGSALTFTIVYGGTGNPGYTLHGVGTIALDGSISGTVDNNCQTFSMPAGTATAIAAPAACPVGTIQSSSPVETVSVNSASSAPTSSIGSLASGMNYLLVASGIWQNNNINSADAEYASVDNWNTVMDGYNINPYFLGAGEFDLQVNGTFIDWGAYNTAHTYSYLYAGTGSPVNFLVFDGDSNVSQINQGWYGDNTGSLSVNIYSCDPVATPTPTKDQCKDNGWKTLVDSQGHKFKNQGDCVSFFATKGKNLGAGN